MRHETYSLENQDLEVIEGTTGRLARHLPFSMVFRKGGHNKMNTTPNVISACDSQICNAEEPRCTELSAEDLHAVSGGLTFIFKLVAVKTVSWAHD